MRSSADGVFAAKLDQSFVWPPEPVAPRPSFREEAWRLVGLSDRVLCCEIRAVATGLEVQARYGAEEDPIRTQLTTNLRDARIVATRWREAALARGSFLDLGVNG